MTDGFGQVGGMEDLSNLGNHRVERRLGKRFDPDIDRSRDRALDRHGNNSRPAENLVHRLCIPGRRLKRMASADTNPSLRGCSACPWDGPIRSAISWSTPEVHSGSGFISNLN